jgi:outer membrane protein TolC
VIPAAAHCSLAPILKVPLPVGDGTALLKRRPDVREADRTLAAAIARTGVATAGLYPSVSLGGSVNTAGVSFGDLGKSSGVSFSIGPLISWSFPNIALAKAQIAAAQATSDAALASFDGTVLTALQETETALTNYANDLTRHTSLLSARDHNAEAVRIVRLRYQYGRESFINVLDAQRSLADTEATLAANQANLTNDQIAVFKALGGGWQDQAASAGAAGAASAPTN